MDMTRETYSVAEIAVALETTPVTIYAWRKMLTEAGRIQMKPRYTYKELLPFVRMVSHKQAKPCAPNKGELLRRQLQIDGFIR